MWYKRRYYLFIGIMLAVALTVPTAAEALPDSVAEYMARLASDNLYSFYLDGDKPISVPEFSIDVPLESIVDESSTEALPEDAVVVQALNFSRYEVGESPKLLFANETDFSVDATVLGTAKIEKKAVLIVHTHGTESYLPDGAEYYIEGEEFRSTDTSANVVAAGDVFAATLRSEGFTVYHDRRMFDEASFDKAYAASRAAVKEWLASHDDIGYVIDIHRDSIEDNEGRSLKTYCEIDGRGAAQVMLVVGTDEAGANHPAWADNLALAVQYQKSLNRYPTFARPVYLRSASYNQQLSSGSLLLEIGSSANTLEEAKRAAELAALCFSALFS